VDCTLCFAIIELISPTMLRLLSSRSLEVDSKAEEMDSAAAAAAAAAASLINPSHLNPVARLCPGSAGC